MASFWERAGSAWEAFRGTDQRNTTLDLLREVYGKQVSASGKTVTVNTAIRVSAALACGRVISQGIASMPFKLLRQKGLDIQPALEHRLYDMLMVAPNDLQSAFEFKEQMAMHLVFCGNAYIWIPKVSRGIGELYLLEPSWVTVEYKWPEAPRYVVRPPTQDQKFVLEDSEIWHIKGPAWCAYLGLETTALARDALGLAMSIEEGQSKFQDNGVRSSGFLSVEGTVAEDQYKKLTKWIEQKHMGSQNSGSPMILDRAAKWVTQTMSNVDAQMVEMRKFQIEEVCRFMGVMPIMVGASDKTATYASAEQMFLAHLVHTIGPWATRIEGSADRWLLSQQERRAGLYWKFNEKALMRMSAIEQADYLMKLSGGPVLTRNEARALLDKNPLDGLDEILTPQNTVAGDPPRFEPTPPPAPGDGAKPFGK